MTKCDLLFVWFDFYVQFSIFSVIKEKAFLGWTCNKQRIKWLAQGHNVVSSVRLKPATHRSRGKHSTTELLKVIRYLRWNIHFIGNIKTIGQKKKEDGWTDIFFSKSADILRNSPIKPFCNRKQLRFIGLCSFSLSICSFLFLHPNLWILCMYVIRPTEEIDKCIKDASVWWAERESEFD